MRVRWLLSRHLTLEEERLRETMSPRVLAYFEGLRTGSAPAGAAGLVPPAGGTAMPAAAPSQGGTAGAGQAAFGSAVAAPAGAGAGAMAPMAGSAREPKVARDLKKEPSALASYQGTMLVARLNYPQATASNIARKLTPAGLFDKVAVDRGELRYLPLWQLHLTVKPSLYMNSFVKMFARGADQPVKEKVYINALNGRLLVIRDKFRFENVASEDPTKIKDLDGVADFEERPLDPAMPDLVAPHLDTRLAAAMGFKMFGVTADEVKLVLLPVWAFTTRVAGKWTAEVKYLDGVLGMEIPGNPFGGL